MYKRRWVVLAIFVMYSASNALQWIQYSIIANIVQRYYNITSTWVDWTSMIFMILYIPLIFPASWILDKLGLRIAAISGVLGTCLGAWVKCFSVSPDLFWVGFVGQSIVAASQVFILSLPAKVAAVWFGPDQVSSACSIGVFGNQHHFELTSGWRATQFAAFRDSMKLSKAYRRYVRSSAQAAAIKPGLPMPISP
uniref:Major facilitator superfamily (MFS) profile domain-containing protein n=1 Tax=Anopheles culicifacies TaxID=139723 RepID=A0A182MA55_9DIPT